MPPRRAASRPTTGPTAPPSPLPGHGDDSELPPPHVSSLEDESAAAGAPSADADAAVADLLSTVLRWDFDALVAREGAAEASPDDPRAKLQLKQLPLTFKDANVRWWLEGRSKREKKRERAIGIGFFFRLSFSSQPFQNAEDGGLSNNF